MQNNGRHEVATPHSRLQAFIAVRQRNIGKLIEQQADWDRQSSAMHLVRAVIKLLKRLRVEHTDEKVERGIVAVGNDAEDRLFTLSELSQLQCVVAGDALDLRQGKGRESNGGAHEDAHSRLAGSLLKNGILPHSDMIRIFLPQRLEKQVERRLVLLIVVMHVSVVEHGEHHIHRLFLFRCLVQKIEHERAVQRRFAFLPKRIGLCSILRRGVLDEVIHQPEHVRVLSDVVERIIGIGVRRINEVKDADNVAVLQEQRRGGTQNFPLWICGYVGRVGKHDIRCNDTAALARTAAADHNLQQIPLMHAPIQSHLDVLGEDHIVIGMLAVAVFAVEDACAAPFCAAVFLAGALVFPFPVVECDSSGIEQQRTGDEFQRVGHPANGKGALQHLTETPRPLKEVHAVLVGISSYRRQPYHRSGQRCPHQGSAAKVSLFRFDDGRLL